MKRIAVFPGSFDPVTLGHENIVRRAASLFDEIIVGLGHNTTKKSMFDPEQRLTWLKVVFGDLQNVKIEAYEGLTVDFCRKNNASFIVRGLRNTSDFDIECAIAQMNRSLNPGIETVLMYTDPRFAHIHSTVVREIIKNNGNVKEFIPSQIRINV